ncbi:OsmC family protein [Gramella sp. GC03-9]|uniref:OsmC family protein n=1 Tax=Christiangramia oceanisediminis TaxID=2920386 RepID=A0A9X2KZD1_9FLAO|nr:OsmC family protein [Gramella oceanisediminis]MCP9201029.1 OsmC family protein [Gramella oceanisediminis]
MTSKVVYLGDLRTESVHLQSGSKMITDAPVDNHGKGEAFSPTDTVANALATCMLTVMGIKARDLGVELNGTSAKVLKTMAADPRRISQIDIEINFSASFGEKNNKILENTARNCPVLHSLHPDIQKNISFSYS